RDVLQAPPLAVLADTAAGAKAVADGSASRIQRRRSIPGVAYLMAAKRSIASKGATDDISTEADISVPERAVVHPGSLHEVAGCMAARRTSDCSSSSTASSSCSSDDNNSDSSGGGGDSDDTLAPADALAGAAAPDSNSPDVVTLTAGDGSIASSVRSYYSCSVVQPAEAPPPPPLMQQLPTEADEQIIESPESGLAAEGQQTHAPQRRQLRLGRWRTASTCMASARQQPSLGVRPARMSLGSAPCQEQSSTAHVAHRKLSGALGKLLLAPPPPSAAEQAKMDAWAADGDEFSASDYDLSGTYFELAPPPKPLLGDGGAMARRKHSAGECTTPESRLSSTSTVVDEGAAALGAEQYKRIFVSSARKLQLQCGRRDMSCVVHIKTMMTKASEHYVVVSGGRSLDAYRISRGVLAELCLGAALEEEEGCAKSRVPLVTAYPARRRSAQQAQRRGPRRAASASPSSSSSVVEVPLSSPPPPSPSAEIADAALAKIATEAEAAELAEYGMGDLVSLAGPAPAMASGDDEARDARPTYRRYRRRRASRWGQMSSAAAPPLQHQSGVAGAIAAL
ncbi:hypothetical protein GGI00_004676, partial [Coemansia sp. RSA 2681]